MVPGGFIPIPSLQLWPITPLSTSGWLSRLPRDTFWLPCARMATVAITWLEWMPGASLIVLFKISPVRLKGCKPPITIISGHKGSAMNGNEVFYTQSRLVWDNLFIANFSKDPPQAEGSVVVNCWGNYHLLRLNRQPHVFFFPAHIFCCFVRSCFHLHFFNLHLRLSHNDYFHHPCSQFAYPPYVPL